MKCKLCNSEMKIGKAFDTLLNNCRYIAPQDRILKNPILIDCWKCSKCGYSEDLEMDDASLSCQYSGSSI